MATDRAIQAEHQTKYPALWNLTETFLKKYGGKVHINWGAPFSVRTKVTEGRLEVDFDVGRLDVRLEHTSAPREVSFTTDPDLFSGHLFDEQIGDCAAGLGWKVQGGNNQDAAATCAFLREPANVEDLKRLALGAGDSISFHAAGIFLVLRTAEFARLESVTEATRMMLRRFAEARPPAAVPPAVRVTGKSPSPAQLKKWPNWSRCLDEEDEEGQDETTLRPDTEQSEIGPKTILTAVDIETPGKRKLAGSLLSDLPGRGLLNASPGVLSVFEGKSVRQVLVKDESWSPLPPPGATIQADDPKRMPMIIRSVLLFPGGQRLEWVLESDGRLRK